MTIRPDRDTGIGKRLLRIGLVVLALLVPATAQAAEPELSFAALRAAHAEPGSRFLDIDGVRMHYVDEGQGRAVVLLNASYMNLSSWHGVAKQLSTRHRVIRLDFPTVGLTGGSTGSAPDAAPDAAIDIRAFERLVIAVMDRLGVAKAGLVGTSSGGIVAFRLAAARPDRFDRLVLLNAAGLPRTAATNPLRQLPRAPGAPEPGSLEFWRKSLMDNFADPTRLAPEFVAQVHDFNHREGQAREGQVFLKTFATGDPQSVLGQIRQPTLILWGEKGVTLSHLEAEVFLQWLVAAPAMVKKYADAGHYPQVEQPAPVADDIAAFLAGSVDTRLRPAPGPAVHALVDSAFWRANSGLWQGEDVYLTASGERKIDAYANLTEMKLDGDALEEEEYRFYPPSEMTSAMAAGQLRPGEGLELRRRMKGRLADRGGRVVMAADTSGQGPGTIVELQPLTPGTGLMTVRASAGSTDSYRVHIDVTAPDQRIRTTLGLASGASAGEPAGSLRGIALFREQRKTPASKAALLTELRTRFKVAVVVETGPDGKPVVRRVGN